MTPSELHGKNCLDSHEPIADTPEVASASSLVVSRKDFGFCDPKQSIHGFLFASIDFYQRSTRGKSADCAFTGAGY